MFRHCISNKFNHDHLHSQCRWTLEVLLVPDQEFSLCYSQSITEAGSGPQSEMLLTLMPQKMLVSPTVLPWSKRILLHGTRIQFCFAFSINAHSKFHLLGIPSYTNQPLNNWS